MKHFAREVEIAKDLIPAKPGPDRVKQVTPENFKVSQLAPAEYRLEIPLNSCIVLHISGQVFKAIASHEITERQAMLAVAYRFYKTTSN